MIFCQFVNVQMQIDRFCLQLIAPFLMCYVMIMMCYVMCCADVLCGDYDMLN